MDVKRMDNINVYNYGSSVVIFSTRDKQYIIKPAVDGVPSMIPLTWSEIDYWNSNSNAIRIGLVRFQKELEEAIYEGLKIYDWRDILFEDVIEDIILNPSKDKLQKIVDIKNVALIERVKGILTALKNSADYDISTRVDKIITTRYTEISHGKLKSDIVLSLKDAVKAVAVEDVDKLKAKNEAMEKELVDMKAMMTKLMEAQEKSSPVDTAVTGEESKKKPVGRPPKSDK